MSDSSNAHNSSSFPRWPFSNRLNETDPLEWLSKNSKTLLYLAAFLILAIFLLYQISNRRTNKQEANYIKAANEFSLFLKGKTAPENLQALLALMQEHSELYSVYGASVAQELIIQNKWQEAESLAQNTLKRTQSKALTHYHQFAEISFLIAAQKWQEALFQAEDFQKRLSLLFAQAKSETDSVSSSKLFALNLLRIGMLQQQLGHNKEELQTWQLWKEYAGLEAGAFDKSHVDRAAFKEVMQFFSQGTISLFDYFTYRIHLLSAGIKQV